MPAKREHGKTIATELRHWTSSFQKRRIAHLHYISIV